MKLLLAFFLFLFTIQFCLGQDKPDGVFKDYHDSGELKVQGQYLSNKKVGEWKYYHKNGQISELYSYEAGKRNKEYITYYEDGIVKIKIEKEGGVYVTSSFYESGKLFYKRQNETGYYRSYYESGTIKVEANYLERELVGEWKKYYENGLLEWLVNYEEGYRQLAYKHFYENGDLKLEGNNFKDKLFGEEKRYLPNNVLEWIGSYKDGLFVKTWIKFDADGNEIEKIKFKNGIAKNAEYKDVIKPTIVADGVIERVPVYPGCEYALTNTTRLKCMNQNVAQFIVKNFDTKMTTDLGVSGRQKIYVFFKINTKGEVTNVNARARHPVLRREAIRVVQMLPNVKPGEQRGKQVIMPFAIPIVFQVE
jgi:antitoxin component YwqK of YwqJK toxin-antitoxin module